MQHQMEARGCAGLLCGVKRTRPLLQSNLSQSPLIKLSATAVLPQIGGGYQTALIARHRA
jgi:hypothetical protein